MNRSTRSHKPVLLEGLPNRKRRRVTVVPSVSPSSIRNYVNGDPLQDYLKMYSHKNGFQGETFDPFTKFIVEQGQRFEDLLIRYIRQNKISYNVVTVCQDGYTINDEGLKKVRDLMKIGTPVIHSAPLRNPKNNTAGIADLLVRSDFVNSLTNKPSMIDGEGLEKLNDEDEGDLVDIPAPNLGIPFHYVVIDIKFSTLNLTSSGRYLSNSGENRYYKSQLYIYNEALGYLQGYTPKQAYILGRRYKYTSKGVSEVGYCPLNRLGVVDFTRDCSIQATTEKAIQWRKTLFLEGDKMSIHPPSRPELYPNMCAKPCSFDKTKMNLATKYGEITLLYQCGVKCRTKALQEGVSSFFDERCSSELLGMGSSGETSYAETINRMIEINRDPTLPEVTPEKLETNIHSWRSRSREMFVDFETLFDVIFDENDVLNQEKKELIFMIGVGWYDGGVEENEEESSEYPPAPTPRPNGRSFNYISFVAKDKTLAEERRIMIEFKNFVNSRSVDGVPPKLWHWCAEESFWNRAVERQTKGLTSEVVQNLEQDIQSRSNSFNEADRESLFLYEENGSSQLRWMDMRDIFITREEPIVFRGVFGFKLKDIAKKLRNMGEISCQIESLTSNGSMASVNALQYYQGRYKEKSIIKDVETYNRFDVRVLWEILEWLRRRM